jgi:hypothetical protein
MPFDVRRVFKTSDLRRRDMEWLIDVVAWVLFGAVAGWVASMIMGER